MGRRYIPSGKILYEQVLTNSKLYKAEYREMYGSDTNILGVNINNTNPPKWLYEKNLIPLFHWKLNNMESGEEGEIYFSDSGKFGRRLRKNGVVLNNGEYIYKSLNLDGTPLLGSTENIGNELILNQFTYCCWYKVEEIHDRFQFLNIGNDIVIFMNPSNLLGGSIYINGTNSVIEITDFQDREYTGPSVNEYTFLSVSYNSLYDTSSTIKGICQICIMQNKHAQFTSDGKQQILNFYVTDSDNMSNKSGNVDINNMEISIGLETIYNRALEDIRFYDRFLTINEIGAIYNDGMGTYQQTNNSYPTIRHPINWYKLQEFSYDNETLYVVNDSGLNPYLLHIDQENYIDTNQPITGIPVENWMTCTNVYNGGVLYREDINGLYLLNKYSISLWFKFIDENENSDIYLIRSFSNYLNIYYDHTDGTITYTVDGGISYELKSSSILQNRWYHLCCTYNYKTPNYATLGNVNIYLDGILNNSDYNFPIVSDNGIKIGGTSNPTCQNFLFDIRIFDYELTPTEIDQICNNRHPILF